MGGRKRERSCDSNDNESDLKKLKRSLDLSNTCDRIAEIKLLNSSENSITASVLSTSCSYQNQSFESYALNLSGDVDNVSEASVEAEYNNDVLEASVEA